MLLYLVAFPVYAEVVVSGLDGETQNNVLLTLSLTKEKCESPEWKIQGLFDKADKEIDQALRALGYYHASVSKKSLTFKDGCWKAAFAIDPGKRVFVSDVTILINGDAHNDRYFSRLLKNLPLKKGSPVNHAHYESMKSKIESLALERGYLQGQFTEHKLLINKQDNSAQIRLVFDAGKRRVFDEVVVEQDILDPELVKKYVSIKSGAFYNSEQVVDYP